MRTLFCFGLCIGTFRETSIIIVLPFCHLFSGGGSPTVDSSTLGESSIPYSEFLDKLNSGEVAYVEFLAPSGDAAYVTFKANANAKIRIGEGYPMEDPGGWSSPAFVIKAVAKKGVPYKFVVPGLEDSFK